MAWRRFKREATVAEYYPPPRKRDDDEEEDRKLPKATAVRRPQLYGRPWVRPNEGWRLD